MSPTPERVWIGALAVALFAGVWLAFGPSLDAGFVSWDDGLTVTDNYRIRDLSPESLDWMARTSWAGHYQPLSWLSLALDVRRAGLDPAAFHATNVALHALGALVLFALALRVFRLGTTRGEEARRAGLPLVLAAAVAAGLHAFHPLRCESVCWVTERRDVLSAPLFFLSLLLYLDARRTGSGPEPEGRWLGASAAAAGLAVLAFFASVSLTDSAALTLVSTPGFVASAALWWASAFCATRGMGSRAGWLGPLAFMVLSLGAKAWALVLPAVFLCLDFWPLGRLGPREGRLRRAVALVLEKAPAWALALVFARLAQWAQVAQQGAVDVWSVHSFGERIVQGLYGLSFYPAKTLWPFGLGPLVPLPEQLSLLEPRFAVAALAVLLAAGIALATLRRAPAIAAGLASYAIIVSPVLGLQQSGPQLVADRYATLAGFPLACLLAGGVWLVARRSPRVSLVAWGLAGLVLVGLIGASRTQSRIWHSSERLFEHAVAQHPTASIAWLNLGLARADRARSLDDPAARDALYGAALEAVGEARRLRPGQPLFRMNEAILRVGRSDARGALPPEELEAALALADEAIAEAEALGLRDGQWYWHHGSLWLRAGDLSRAIERFEQARALRPHWPAATHTLVASLLEQAPREPTPAAAFARVERARAVLALPSAPRDAEAVWLAAGALDLRWQLLGSLGRSRAEVDDARRQALAAWRAVPADHPHHGAAEARMADLEAPTGS